jgi:metal-responsive CopG/Arc/MetJ family transcriptional regulator
MPDTEKITINMPTVDLGKIDLLVQEGLYSNRTDFIRTAIRTQMDKHTFEIQQSVSRHSYVIGLLTYNRHDFEKYKQKNEKLKIAIVGLLHLQEDISPELAAEVVESIEVRGVFIASEAVKSALASRTDKIYLRTKIS